MKMFAVAIVVIAVAATALALPLDLCGTKCVSRKGAAVLPPDFSEPVMQEIQKVVEMFFGDMGANATAASAEQSGEVQQMKAHVINAYRQMLFVNAIMVHQQREVDEVTQHLLPTSQRMILEHSTKARDAQIGVGVARQQLLEVTQSMPREDFIGKQREYSNVIRELRTLLDTVTGDNQPLSQDPQGMPAHSFLMQVTHKQLGAPIQAGISSSDNSTAPSVAPRDRVVTLIIELIESFKQSRELERTHATLARKRWEDRLQFVQEDMDLALAEAAAQRTFAYGHMGFSIKLQKNLRKETSRQYMLLGWSRMLRHDLTAFGVNLDQSVRMRQGIRLSFLELEHFLTNGYTPYFPDPQNGCDGNGGETDACGVCGGSNTTCVACDGTVSGSATIDMCGVCGDGTGSTCRYFCDGKANSGRVEDVCGVCGGDGQSCAGCDTIPHSPLHFDTCGVCDGDGSVCAKEKGCVDAVCSGHIACPAPKRVTSLGFASCCFDPSVDCV